MSREDPDVIDAVEKALRVLMLFSAEHDALSVSEVAELTGFTRATARRILLTLERNGFATADDRRFRLTPKVLRLGYGYLSAAPWWEHALGHMRALADRVGESCSLATLDGDEIVYLARVPGRHSMSITLNTGSRLPAYPTSMGRVLLAALPPAALDAYLARASLDALTPRTTVDPDALRAELDRVRAQGWALVDGEREQGVRSAAAPVRGGDGRVLAALNVSVNAARIDVDDLAARIVPALVATAGAVSQDVAHVPA